MAEIEEKEGVRVKGVTVEENKEAVAELGGVDLVAVVEADETVLAKEMQARAKGVGEKDVVEREKGAREVARVVEQTVGGAVAEVGGVLAVNRKGHPEGTQAAVEVDWVEAGGNWATEEQATAVETAAEGVGSGERAVEHTVEVGAAAEQMVGMGAVEGVAVPVVGPKVHPGGMRAGAGVDWV